jgi:hypothetical protein
MTADRAEILANVAGDFRRGLGGSFEDTAIAALVVMPFALALVLVVNATAWWPSAVMIALFVLVTGAGTLWNAGWRARTSVADSGE